MTEEEIREFCWYVRESRVTIDGVIIRLIPYHSHIRDIIDIQQVDAVGSIVHINTKLSYEEAIAMFRYNVNIHEDY